jgi:predicted ester cyclase
MLSIRTSVTPTKLNKQSTLMKTFLAILFVMSFDVGCTQNQSSLLEKNKAIVRRAEEEVWSKGNLSVANELYATNFIGHSSRGETHGLAEFKKHVIEARTAFPDWNEHIEDILAEEDRVVIRITCTGTNRGPLWNNLPTGRQLKVGEIAIHRIVDGKIAEQWNETDYLTGQQQLGVSFPDTKKPSKN